MPKHMVHPQVNEIAQNTGLDKITVQKIVEALMEAIKDSLSNDDNVYLLMASNCISKALDTL